MDKTFDTVDMKVAEAEFFLRKMAGSCMLVDEHSFYFSAFLAASRTVTLALQQFADLDGFDEWYEPHREKLKKDKIAKFFLDTRNSHLHGGVYPIRGGSFSKEKSKSHFGDYEYNSETLGEDDVLSRSRGFFLCLIEIVYDCYVKLGPQIDPQQYYTREHFDGTIDQAEAQVYGWVMTSLISEGFTEDDRWSELRSKMSGCRINHLFHAYLGRVTPQPVEPEEYRDFEPSDEDRGWVHIPAGFQSIEEWVQFIGGERHNK